MGSCGTEQAEKSRVRGVSSTRNPAAQEDGAQRSDAAVVRNKRASVRRKSANCTSMTLLYHTGSLHVPERGSRSEIHAGGAAPHDASIAATRADSRIAVHSETIMSTTAEILEKS